MARDGGGDILGVRCEPCPGHTAVTPLHSCITHIIWSSFSIHYHRRPSKSLIRSSCQRKYRHKHILCSASVSLSFLWSSFQCSVSLEGASQCLIKKDVFPCCSIGLCCFQSFSTHYTTHLTFHGHGQGHRSSFLLSVSGQRASLLFLCSGGRAWWTVAQCGQPKTPGGVYGLSWAEDVGDHGDGGMVGWWGWLLG